MKIDRLDLKRFGCFTDCSLDLSAPGMHVVVGLNEAGKSTAMAAVRQLLFGIPVRSPHAFVHEMRDLCLGASLRGEDENSLEIVRVKRQTGTLRDARGKVLDESVLARFRQDVDEAVYASLFMIGHDEIARGGEALLVNDGEVGRALFSASRGTTDLNAVLAKLDDRAAALFKNAASNPKLNAAIRGHKDHAAVVKELSVSASEVVRLDERLRAAQKDYDGMANERKDLARRRTQLERIRAARPQLAARHDCLSKADESERLGPLVDVTVGESLAEARTQRSDSERRHTSARTSIERLDQKLSGLCIDWVLLEQRDAIERLQADIGGYRQNVKDLPGLERREGSALRDLEEPERRLPATCPLDAEGRPSLTVAQEERIRALAESRSKLDSKLEHAAEQIDETANSLDGLRSGVEALDKPMDVDGLEVVAGRIRKAGDLEATRTTKLAQLRTVDTTVANALAALGLNGVDVHAVDAVAAPSVDTIRQTRADLEKYANVIDQIQEQIEVEGTKRDAAATELDELLQTERPPSEDELLASRSRREEGWRLVRARWIDGSADPETVEPWSGGEPLERAYEGAVVEADNVADRLRVEAGAVERRASLERQLEVIDGLLAAREEALGHAGADRKSAEYSWVRLWEAVGVVPQSPEAMEIWRDDFRVCVQQSVEARSLTAEIEGLAETIARHQADLVSSLEAVGNQPPDGMSLLGLLDRADDLVATALDVRQDHRTLTTSCAETEKVLRRHTNAHAKAEEAIAEWRQRWAEAGAIIGLDDTASPKEAIAVLQTLAEITIRARELEDTQRRISGIERRNASFTDGIAALLSKLDGHDDLADVDPDVAVEGLVRRLTAAQEAATEHRTTSEERQTHDNDRAHAGVAAADASNWIAGMVAAAGVKDETELAEAIARSGTHAALIDQVAQLEEDLRVATGLPVEEIEREAAEMTGVEIDPEIDELVRRIEDLDELLKGQGKTVGELTKERALFDASGNAADAMTAAQQSLTDVARFGEEYVQILLAKQLLEEQVSVYRDEHQGPLLARARELFSRLTLGRYLGLDTDTDAKGNPYLLARTAADKLLEVGALSTGTRDQLYLALRLAALEQFIERRGSLPLVLDDLFVHFDDSRTAAGLAVLDEVSDHAQVLLFTHHAQVARQAVDVIDANRLTVHELA